MLWGPPGQTSPLRPLWDRNPQGFGTPKMRIALGQDPGVTRPEEPFSLRAGPLWMRPPGQSPCPHLSTNGLFVLMQERESGNLGGPQPESPIPQSPPLTACSPHTPFFPLLGSPHPLPAQVFPGIVGPGNGGGREKPIRVWGTDPEPPRTTLGCPPGHEHPVGAVLDPESPQNLRHPMKEL